MTWFPHSKESTPMMPGANPFADTAALVDTMDSQPTSTYTSAGTRSLFDPATWRSPPMPSRSSTASSTWSNSSDLSERPSRRFKYETLPDEDEGKDSSSFSMSSSAAAMGVSARAASAGFSKKISKQLSSMRLWHHGRGGSESGDLGEVRGRQFERTSSSYRAETPRRDVISRGNLLMGEDDIGTAALDSLEYAERRSAPWDDRL